ncbi:hypothetical protein HF521_022599 [Silurus meridionalis]|uniref:Vacuolar protein sorting 13 homolog C n=1 Tax=Silurus meridionalis TaxID=175797 RepID=A0A8T0B9Q3_SILME|nr:hypothetical protein HF521_022599 [Silurus meridionalis]
MVFESVLSDVLNRFIGDYVENLDKSQLKIGIWGGDVVLENLRVKENTLSELDVPFKVKAGQIGKLTLKIPWKNLYSEAVVATLDGLYLLVVPEATIKYDAAKEEKHLQEAKQKELQRIEEALLLVARREKRPDEKKDTFSEKLFTQIIKNLQVKISSIHIRYEDDVSDPQKPLSVGVTLSELSLQTADENWRTCILNEAVKIIYKLGRLECLCAYWNVNSPMFYRDPWEKIVEKLKAGISSKDVELKGYEYIFKPIFASAKIRINPNADVELKSPKVNLHLEVQNIAVEMSKPQYLSVVELLESIDCMVKNGPYRKFKPDVPVNKHARQWWMYGINSVLEVRIKRFNQMWSWTHIREHRQKLKAYKMAFKAKLTHSKLREDTEKQIMELEKDLDVFNITLARQQAHMEVVRSGQKLTAKKAKQNHGGGGLFSSFFGRKERKKKDQEEEDKEEESIDAVMTTEEKTKLYTAIGYSENSPNLALPKNYVAVIVNFKLLQTSVTVREEASIPEILKVQMIGLSTTVSQRPGAQAIKVEASLEHWYVTGLQQQGITPSLIASVGNANSSLLSVRFELNPEDTAVDQLLYVHSQPVEIIYDALTINSIVEFFNTAKGVDLEVITSATLSKLEEIKEKTASGLSHIIETRKVLDLKIDLKPSYLLLPKSGFYHNKSELIIIDFGNLQLNSVCQSTPEQASASFSSLEEIMDRAYDRFSLELRSVQVLYSKSGDMWRSTNKQGTSSQHILQPMDFTLGLAKCMVEKDIRMPRFKVNGELPLLHVKISDLMIQGVLELVDSIPFPNVSSTPPSTPDQKAMPGLLADSRLKVISVDPSALPYSMVSDSEEDTAEKYPNEDAQRLVLEELTDVHFKFEIKTVLLELTSQDAQEVTVLAFNVSQLGCEGKMRTYDLTVKSYLHKISLDYCDMKDAQNQPLHLITSSEKHGSDLLIIDYIKADVSGPSFQSVFDNTEQMLKVEFSSLEFLLHTKALLSTISYLNRALSKFTPSKERDIKRPADRVTTEKTVSSGSRDKRVISFKLFAVLGSFGVTICDDRSSIAEIQIQGIDASMVVQAKETEVFARLRNVLVIDVDTKPYTKRWCLLWFIYLHKFLISLLDSFSYQNPSADEKFVDNFQAAKKAISIATAQAAEKAAASVKDFALKSFRLSMDIRLKAPLIIIPQSSISQNAFVVDLGLITISNTFTLTPAPGFSLPAVVEIMDVKLTHLKLLRTVLKHEAPQPQLEILQPVNVELLVKRNLAASWFTKIPGVEVRGLLKSMNIKIGCEDLCVLMKILAENTEEGNKRSTDTMKLTVEDKPETSKVPVETETHPAVGSGKLNENVVSVLLKFEIMEVLLTLCKPKNGIECPFLVLTAAELGIDTIVHSFDMQATTYIKTISVKCPDISDIHGEPVCILSSSAKQGAELLKVEYFKADRDGPNFSTIFENMQQKMNIIFSSLDLTLHTETILSIMEFLSTILSCSSLSSPEKESKINEETKATPVRSKSSLYEEDIIDLKIHVQLGAFNVLLCDQQCNIADMKIRDLHGSLLMKENETHMSARLRDFVVINLDPETVHKKVVCIVDDEVFSFNMGLTPKATEGEGYTDTSKVDGKIKLNVGCIQVVYLQKFVMILVKFTNSFQMAKEALSVATAQAAEKAVSSVRDFAQKSFRISLDIRLKAPIIIIPQSSMSHNAVEADLGLITVRNSFSLLPVENCPLPAVIDIIDLELTQLKLSRIFMEKGHNKPSSELLQPVNLVLSVRRNLAATWYHKMAALEVDGDLKPMEVALNQDDLVLLLKILMENISEASSVQPCVSPDPGINQANVPTRSCTHNETEHAGQPPESKLAESELMETVKFNFTVESLGLVLYNDDSTQPGVHQKRLCIGEFMLHKITASGKMFSDSSMEVTSILTTCTLDDRRSNTERITSRMLKKLDDSSDAMIDLKYSQNRDESSVVAVFQKLYLCASMEFLMAVAEFFIQALAQAKAQGTVTDKPRSLPLKQISEQKGHGELNAGQKIKVHVVVIDPEVVFVANLMKADAPALVASFQCDFKLLSEEANQVMKVNLKGLKILASPFIRNKESKAVTTVLRPCSVLLETRISASDSLTGSVTIDHVTVKISPIILNTVLTITAAMTPQSKEEVVCQKPFELSTLWAVRNIYSCNFWFLDVETATEVTEKFHEIHSSNKHQTFTVDVKVVQVTLESGQGHHTVPLLLAESSLTGCARNWSSLLSLSADMTLEVNYFNESYAVWEPLIERVDNGKRRWNLGIEIKNNPVWDKSPVPGDDFIVLPESCTSINICSKDTMNITLSNCCLNVFYNLIQAFSEGTVSSFDHSLKEKAPFTIRNSLGIPLIIEHSANLRLVVSSSQSKMPEVGVEESLDLEYSIFENTTRVKLSTLQRQESCLFNLSIVPKGYSEISNIPVDKPGRRLYNVQKSTHQESVSVLLQISASEGNKVITVRSPLQIKNHFSVPFAILKYCPDLGGLVNVGVAEPDKEFHVTLDSYRCRLFVMPVGPLEGQYQISTTHIAWKEQVHKSSEVHSIMQCPAKDSSLRPVVINTLAVKDNLSHIDSQREEEWDPAYIIHLHPTVFLRNLLPYSIRCLMEGSADFVELEEGSTADLLNANIMGEIMELVLVKYQGRNWNSHVKITSAMQELFPVCFTSDTSENLTVDVYAHMSHMAGQLIISIFSPYWIINKTGRVLQYRAEDIHVKHPSDFRDVILFSFKKKNIFSKNKLQLCVSTSSWSDGFSLDTVGSYGCVRCQDKNMDFLVEISIQLSSFNLTRIVTISPFYTLVNKSSFELEVGEVKNDSNVSNKWHYISSTECLPLWPESSTEKLCVRVVGTELASKSFFLNKQDNGTLLCMEQYGGIIVDANITDHSTAISFTDYYDGAAPALLVNHTARDTITIRQSGCEAFSDLKPGEVQLFVWDNPAGVRKLCWTCQGYSGELDLIKDQKGQFTFDGLTQIHWVSFLDGRQRIFLFTEDVAVVTKACQAEELEQFQKEVNISVQNLGLSLINNNNRHEIAYMGITSSGVVWEMKPKNRWKAFKHKSISVLEKAYQNHLNGKTETGWLKLETGIEVDFTRMQMRLPYSCAIRRNFLAGIHVELKQSPHQRSLRAQLHWLQVDNQLTGAIFPIVFHPVPPPKSIVLDSEPKPFIDVSIITRFNEHSQVMQFKYFMVLVQEMAVKMDQGFLGEILAFFSPATSIQADKKKSNLIEKDLNSLQTQLMESSITDTSGLSFFEHFHISPIKLHLSLSMGSSGDESEEGNMLALQSVNLLLKSIGATLTDVDDLIFKLAFFEMKYQFYRREDLMWAVIKHYTEQFLKQMYVLVLGLDVLGNPFGLIRGLSEGMEAFFYEPFQGAVQGPEEFAEGFVIGMRSFWGHTVGGAAGMVSRITGSVGKGLAAISMDKEYQQKRREEMNRPSKDFGSSLAKGGKGLLKGVVGGVTGIVTKPVEGVMKEGAAGFFKGIGKGLVGVVTRPTGGIVDMASSAFQGIQRAAESTEEVTKLRPVRLIQEDGIIRPYNQHESEGYDLFQRSEIKQLDGEFFREHYQYPGHRKTNIIITNRRVLCVKEIDLIGHFNKEWECQFEHFLMPPFVEGGNVTIYYKEQNKLKVLKDGDSSMRVIHFEATDMAEKLQSAIQNAQVARKQYQMVRKKSQRFINASTTS